MEFAFSGELLVIHRFLDPGNIAIHPSEIDISCFFYGIRIFRGTFGNLHFFILVYFIIIDYLSFFILLMKKKLLIKYFFIINVPINYPPLSKKSLILSKSCPTGPKKIRKIPKNLEKSRKIQIFSLFFLWSRLTFYKKSPHHLS